MSEQINKNEQHEPPKTPASTLHRTHDYGLDILDELDNIDDEQSRRLEVFFRNKKVATLLRGDKVKKRPGIDTFDATLTHIYRAIRDDNPSADQLLYNIEAEIQEWMNDMEKAIAQLNDKTNKVLTKYRSRLTAGNDNFCIQLESKRVREQYL